MFQTGNQTMFVGHFDSSPLEKRLEYKRDESLDKCLLPFPSYSGNSFLLDLSQGGKKTNSTKLQPKRLKL